MNRLVLIILFLLACFGGNASNNERKENNVDFSSPGIRNILKFSYDQLCVNENVAVVDFSDDFNLPKLRTIWANEKSDINCSLYERPGFLRLNAENYQTGSAIKINNTLSQKVRKNTTGEAVIFLELKNLKEGSSSGLYFSKNELNYIGVKIENGKKVLKTQINGNESEGLEISVESLMLRVNINISKACFEYSIDGLSFIKMGDDFEVSEINNCDNFVGIFCLNEKQNGGSVDIDWFYFKPSENYSVQFAENHDNFIKPML